jgi:hypothetical protein
MKVNTPDNFPHYDIEQDGDTLTVHPTGGSTLSGAVSNSLALAHLNQKAKVFLKFNTTKVHLNANDTIGEVEARYHQTYQREHEEFLASPEGKEYQREQEREREAAAKQQAEASRLLNDLSVKSSFRFPPDMPSITGMGRKLEDAVRQQLSIGAQWLADHPEARPFDEGHDDQRRELSQLMEKTDVSGHSGASFSLLMQSLALIARQGFDQYVADAKTNAARQAGR